MPKTILDAVDTKNLLESLSRMRLEAAEKSDSIKSIKTMMEVCPGYTLGT